MSRIAQFRPPDLNHNNFGKYRVGKKTFWSIFLLILAGVSKKSSQNSPPSPRPTRFQKKNAKFQSAPPGKSKLEIAWGERELDFTGLIGLLGSDPNVDFRVGSAQDLSNSAPFCGLAPPPSPP